MIGTRFGHYEITASIGAGGMGEVYRAHDARLNRDVALKVLPALFTGDPDRLARFDREARVLASLNHPNIAHVYGLEEGSHGQRAIVMELVPGPTLAERLAAGPLPLGEALPVIRQIALALEAAHEQGIIHRDLKPANIKVSDDGTVKVLDFGLAKAVDAGRASDPGSANSPTLTNRATQLGVILGTAAYMAPEQAKGRPLDRRADIWAFGCVLYEMLTGKRAFGGDDVTETIASVVKDEPDWNALPADAPAMVSVFLRRCLRKSPKERVQDIGDIRLAIEGAYDPPDRVAGVAGSRRSMLGGWSLPTAAFAVALVMAGGALAWLLKPGQAVVTSPARRFTFTPTDPVVAVGNLNRAVAITPDGTRVLYYAGVGTERVLYERRLDALVATPLRRATQVFELFTSPDGAWIGFNDENDSTLKKMKAGGGPPEPIASIDNPQDRTGALWGIAGATWGPDDTIVYGLNTGNFGLWRVPSTGGTPQSLSTPDKTRGETAYGWPEFLPGGQALLYTVRSEVKDSPFRVWVRDLQTGAAKPLMPGSSARYASGHLIYGLEGNLWAVPFDPARLEVQAGDPIRLVEGVNTHNLGRVDFDVSDDGTLVYLSGETATPRRLVWIDHRRNERTPLDAPPRMYAAVRISPDGTRAALEIQDQDRDIYVWTFARPELRRLTSDRASDEAPVWTRDGRIVFASDRSGTLQLYVQSVDGTAAQALTDNPRHPRPGDVLADGRLLYQESWPGTSADLMSWEFGTKAEPVRLTQDPNSQSFGRVSPDGKWLAYQSDEVQFGVTDIYVRPFPDLQSGKTAVSSGRARLPGWYGNELFYLLSIGDVMSVTMRPGMTPTRPHLVAKGLFRGYDVAPNGRILVIEDVAPATLARQIGIVLNWNRQSGIGNR